MEKFTNRVMIDLEDYMKIIDDKKDTENKLNKELENNKCYINEINDLSKKIINIGLNILDKDGSWEQKQLKEKIRKNETDLSYYKNALYDILFVTIKDQLLCNLIIDTTICNIEKAIEQEQPKEQNND